MEDGQLPSFFYLGNLLDQLKQIGSRDKMELVLSNKFILEYELIEFINKSIYRTYVIDFTKPGHISLPFMIPHWSREATENIKQLHEMLGALFESNELKQFHIDHILFFLSTTDVFHGKSNEKLSKERYLRKNASLLLNLIEAPIPLINATELDTAFNLEEYDEDEIDQFLIGHASVIYKLKPKDFTKINGKFNPEAIPKGFEHKLIERVLAETNISIYVPEWGKYLFVSKFIPTKLGSCRIEENFQKELILKPLMESLFNEQRKEGTQFYKALSNYDFVKRGNLKLLKRNLGDWNRN